MTYSPKLPAEPIKLPDNPFTDFAEPQRIKPDLKGYAARHPDFIQAAAMSRDEFCTYAKIAAPMGADPDEQGYLVNSLKYGLLKHPDHHGFISWMSKSDFEQQYQEY